MEKTNIYVLKLQGGKYYVGKSNDVIGRYQQHVNGQGSAWTKKHKPMSLLEYKSNMSPFEEDKVVKECMAKYGIENVRGGAYVRVELDKVQVEARTFARTKSPEDDRAAQPIYWSCFSSICHERNITLPDNFNFDNPYDPDGIFPANDINIRKKLRRDALGILRRTEDLLEQIDRRDTELLQ